MRIKHITPKLYYVVLIAFTAKAWNSDDDYMVGVMEDHAIDRGGWEYEDYSGPTSDLTSDYKWAFDKVQDRRDFVKALKKYLSKEIKLVTTIDVTAD